MLNVEKILLDNKWKIKSGIITTFKGKFKEKLIDEIETKLDENIEEIVLINSKKNKIEKKDNLLEIYINFWSYKDIVKDSKIELKIINIKKNIYKHKNLIFYRYLWLIFIKDKLIEVIDKNLVNLF